MRATHSIQSHVTVWMIYTMDDENGNGDDFQITGATGNPYIGEALCGARRATLEQKIVSLRNQIIGAISLSTAILLLVSYVK